MVNPVVVDLIHEYEKFSIARGMWAHLRGTCGGTFVTRFDS